MLEANPAAREQAIVTEKVRGNIDIVFEEFEHEAGIGHAREPDARQPGD
jgi:hypothetical protein